MDSQESEDDIFTILTEACQWTNEDNDKISFALDAFNSFIKSSPSSENAVKAVKLSFGSFFPHLQVDKTTLDALCIALSFLKSCYDKFIQDCEKDEASLHAVTELLQQCCTILECCKLALKVLLQVEKIAVENLVDVPQIFLHIVSYSLTHCKRSESLYNGQIDQVQGVLSQLFHLSVEVAAEFVELLSKLEFDPYSDEDSETLTQVCKEMCTTAGCLSQLSEVRGSVTVWRGYTKLIQQYHSVLITRLELCSPITTLVNEISDGLNTLLSLPLKNNALEEKDKKVVPRIIKMTSFCLKVIIVLCEKFNGYLSGCHETLLLLLLLLFRFSPKNVVLNGYPEDVKKNIELQVTIGIEPLLTQLRDDEQFIEEVINSIEKESSVVDDWGCHILLLIAVLFPLRSSVNQHSNLIVSKIFKAMEKGHVSLSFPCRLDGIMSKGKPLSTITLYEHTVIHVCAAVATFDSQQFVLLERELVHWLLSGKTWPSLLAADVWSFIARYGTSDLCKTHCALLVDIFKETHRLPDSSNLHLVTATLLSRIMNKLSPLHKNEITSRLTDAKQNERCIKTWFVLFKEKSKGEDKSCKLQSCVEYFTQEVNIISSRCATGADMKALLCNMEELEVKLEGSKTPLADDPVMKNFIASVALLWTRLPLNYIKCSIVERLVCCLTKISSCVLKDLSSFQLVQVLSSVKKCCLEGSVTVKLQICDLMTSFGQCCSFPQSSYLSTILNAMSDIFSMLMKDDNPLIHQFALDAFVAVAKHTSHEQVLSTSLERCGKDTKDQVTLYLQQKPHPSEQPRLTLLQQQAVRIEKHDFLKPKNSTVLITNEIEMEITAKPLKRQRDCISDNDEEKTYDVHVLVNSLKESQKMVEKIKESNVNIDSVNCKRIKIILENMLSLWTHGKS